MIYGGWQLIIENALHLDSLKLPVRVDHGSSVISLQRYTGQPERPDARLSSHKGFALSNNTPPPHPTPFPKHHTESLCYILNAWLNLPLLTGFGTNWFLFFFFLSVFGSDIFWKPRVRHLPHPLRPQRRKKCIHEIQKLLPTDPITVIDEFVRCLLT